MGQDELCAVFQSHACDAQTHLLIVPKDHVRDCTDPAARRYLSHFVEVADSLHPNAVLVYHHPPFTSIDHLHMHVLVAPFRNAYKKFKHAPAKWKCWLVDARAFAEDLE